MRSGSVLLDLTKQRATRRPSIAHCPASSQAPLTQGCREKPQVTTMIVDPAGFNLVAKMPLLLS
jgi:hypothetical protein